VNTEKIFLLLMQFKRQGEKASFVDENLYFDG